MPFWLVLLTEQKVLNCFVTKAALADSLQQTVDAAKFPTLCEAIHSTDSVHHTALTDRDFLKIRIASSCKIFMILFNFY